jgi:predicted Zn finger-like uncharacterized protein
MEIRCGKCNKLFRVADEKITGSGVKFACTKCGDTVRITSEEFSHYTLSKAAVSALDMFEPKPKDEMASMSERDTEAGQTPGDDVTARTPLSPPKDSDQSSSALPDFLQEKEESVFSEPNPFEELPLGEATQSEQEPPHENEPAFEIPLSSEPEPYTLAEPEKKAEHNPEAVIGPAKESVLESPIEPVIKPMIEPTIETTKEPAAITPAIKSTPQQKIPAEPEQKRDQEQPTMPASDLVPMPQTEPKPQPEPGPEESTIRSHVPETQPAIQSEPSPVQPVAPHPMPKEELLEQIRRETPQAESSRSGRMVLVLLSVFLVLGAAGYGVYRFVLPSLQEAERPAVVMTSTEGLRVVNPSGAIEQNGDLLITGSVENLTDKERPGWYVVVDVYDANGKVLHKIRLLNGKQIYSSTDYDILSKRGVNVAELKAKTLQNQGVVIPAKGSVPFEMRYLQPPVGIASFNATLQPFDPIRLFKEIQKETK